MRPAKVERPLREAGAHHLDEIREPKQRAAMSPRDRMPDVRSFVQCGLGQIEVIHGNQPDKSIDVALIHQQVVVRQPNPVVAFERARKPRRWIVEAIGKTDELRSGSRLSVTSAGRSGKGSSDGPK